MVGKINGGLTSVDDEDDDDDPADSCAKITKQLV
jgi:hypothetical protein